MKSFSSLKFLYTDANLTYATGSNSFKPSITIVPIVLEEISLCPNSSKDLEIYYKFFGRFSINRSFFKIKIDLANLSLSKADFLPFFYNHYFSILNPLEVVNLATTHNLLLRIAVPSSVGRESTKVSPFLQMEQIIYLNFYKLEN